jgi:hypothetical protein
MQKRPYRVTVGAEMLALPLGFRVTGADESADIACLSHNPVAWQCQAVGIGARP